MDRSNGDWVFGRIATVGDERRLAIAGRGADESQPAVEPLFQMVEQSQPIYQTA